MSIRNSRTPFCGYCRFHPEFETNERGELVIREDKDGKKIRVPVNVELKNHKCKRKTAGHWRECKPCSNLANRNHVMSAQKKLKQMGVPEYLNNSRPMSSMSKELKDFVDEHQQKLMTLIQNPSEEELEQLVDCFIMLEHLVQLIEDPKRASHLCVNKDVASRYQSEDLDDLSERDVDVEGSDEEEESIKKRNIFSRNESSSETSSKRTPKCESCRIYQHWLPDTISSAGQKGLPDVKGHKLKCPFSLKNNPQLVKRCILLLCLNSKQHIMSEQIAARRQTEDFVKSNDRAFENLMFDKNAEYKSRRNRIREELKEDPEKWMSIISGEENKAYLAFIILLFYRDEKTDAPKRSTNVKKINLVRPQSRNSASNGVADAVKRQRPEELKEVTTDEALDLSTKSKRVAKVAIVKRESFEIKYLIRSSSQAKSRPVRDARHASIAHAVIPRDRTLPSIAAAAAATATTTTDMAVISPTESFDSFPHPPLWMYQAARNISPFIFPYHSNDRQRLVQQALDQIHLMSHHPYYSNFIH